MWLDTEDARRLIQTAAEQGVTDVPVGDAVAAIERVVRVSSTNELQVIAEKYPFLASNWVLALLSRLRYSLRQQKEYTVVHNLSSTMTALSFFFERRLRDQVVVPPAIAADFARWEQIAHADSHTAADVAELSRLAHRMIESPAFEGLDDIAQRDIYRITAEQLLSQYNSHPDADALDTAVKYFSEASSLSPDVSMDFVRCTTYGGLALLIRAQQKNGRSDLDTAILVLRHAVAAADDEHLQNFVGTASHGLARAFLQRYERDGNTDDLASSLEIFGYGVRAVRARGDPLEPDTGIIAAMLSDALRKRGDAAGVSALTKLLSENG